MIQSLCCSTGVLLLENGLFKCNKCGSEKTAAHSTDTGKEVTSDQRNRLRRQLALDTAKEQETTKRAFDSEGESIPDFL